MSEIEAENAAIPIDLIMIVDRIRNRLKNADSVYDVAEAVGLSAPTLYAFISGRVPTIETLQKLCDYFALTVDVATHKTVQPPCVAPKQAV